MVDDSMMVIKPGVNLQHNHMLVTINILCYERKYSWTRSENKIYLVSKRSDFHSVKHSMPALNFLCLH